jgi:hypothetical protein
MEKMPILDQKDFSNCYAAAASQMIDAYRFSHGDKRTDIITSPVALAVSAKSYHEAVFALNIEAKTKFGLTLQGADVITSDLQPSRFLLAGYNLKDLTSKYPDLEYLNVKYLDEGSLEDIFIRSMQDGGKIRVCDKTTIENILRNGRDLEMIQQMWRDSEKNIFNYALSAQRCAFRSKDFVQTMHAIQASTLKSNLPEYLQTLVDTACAKSSVETKIPPLSNCANSFKILHHVLSQKNPQPVEVHYCANFMREAWKGEKCVSHFSVITGRRKTATGKCEVLIRNSWGKSCKGYPKPENCENGQYWVDEQTLNEANPTFSALLDPEEVTEARKANIIEIPSVEESSDENLKKLFLERTGP